jgi:hypothetical protein
MTILIIRVRSNPRYFSWTPMVSATQAGFAPPSISTVVS